MRKIHTTAELGKFIKVARKTQGLTQEQLSAQSGTGIRFLRDLETGKSSCQIGKALQILTMLGMALTLSESETPPDKGLPL